MITKFVSSAAITPLIELLEPRQFLSAGPTFLQTNLVSDGTFPAAHQDANLSTPWGLAINNSDGSVWVADNGDGLSTIYKNGVPAQGSYSLYGYSTLAITIPPPAGVPGPSAPTTVLYNKAHAFAISSNGVSKPATFLFATEDGTISGWNGSVNPTNAILAVDNSASGAVYKAIAVASNNGQQLLYATDFHNNKIDVFNKNFSPVTLKGSFADPTLPAGYAPFGIQLVQGHLIVTFALQNAEGHDDVPGAGNGFVDVFSTGGKFIRRLASGGALNAPWAVTVAPASFGKFAGDLLVGNFGDGWINVFTTAGKLIQPLENASQQPIVINGLWGLIQGTGKSGNAGGLFFASETDDIFGTLTVNRSK